MMERSRVRKFGIKRISLPHSRRLILTVLAVILIIFIGSIFLAIKNRNDNANKTLFTRVYSEAQAKYDEGQSLVDLNKNLAHDNFVSAEEILSSNKDKFKKGSSEEMQISALLAKVNAALNETSGTKSEEAKEMSLDESDLLALEAKNSKSAYFAQDDSSIYYIDTKGIELVNKSSGKTSLAIAKDDSWAKEGGLGTFLGNLYVLDKEDGIIKFAKGTATGSAYIKSDYFTSDTSPDLGDAQAMAIDGSIYILFSNGKIQKYNKGALQTFSVTGLDKGFSKPTRIWTDADSDSIYVLDRGNGRIVVLGKDGAFKSEYLASVLKNAADFEVLEASKKINILSGGRAFSISL